MNIIKQGAFQQKNFVECKVARRVLVHSAMLPVSVALLFLLSGVEFSERAAAATYCTPLTVSRPSQVINIGSPTVSGPITAGKVIFYTNEPFHFEQVFYGCPNYFIASAWVRSLTTAVSSWNGYPVFPTSVPGIGYAIGVRASLVVNDPQRDTILTMGPNTIGNVVSNAATFPFQMGFKWSLYLVATTNLAPGSYTIPTQALALARSRDWMSSSIDGSPGASSTVYLSGTKVVIKGGTCDLAAGDTNRLIKLATVRPDAFVDKKAGRTTFDITASCSGANNVTFKFTGTPSPRDAWRFKNTGTSSSVDLLLFDRIGADKTITANGDSNTRTVAVSNGKAVLPMGASYFVTTGGAATAGTLAATVTVNITYN